MSNLIRKVRTWFIPIFTLASLFCAEYVAAQNDNQPNGAGQNARSNDRPPAYIKPATTLKMWDENDPNRPKVYIKKTPGTPSQAQSQEELPKEQKIIHLRPPQEAVSAADNQEILSEREAEGTDTLDMEDDVKFDATPIPPTPPNIKKYLKDKYKANNVYEQLLGTPYGPNGRIHFASAGFQVGHVEGDNRDDRLRNKAKAFIASEPSLFGITRSKELVEDEFRTDEQGYTLISFKRYIGKLWLEYSNFHVNFDKDENIRSAGANVMAVSPEVYNAVNRVTLTKGNIRKIIEQDLAYSLNATSVFIHNIEKVAILKEPYVIYKVGVSAEQAVETGIPRDLGSWDYRIDAFSGEILNKRSDSQKLY